MDYDEEDYGGNYDEEAYDEGEAYGEEAYAEEPEMKAEMGAFERAGGTGILGTKIDMSELKGKKMEEIAKKLSRISMEPAERLRIYADALSRKFNDDGVIRMSNESIDEMLSYVSGVKKVKFVNPVGFIMGYAATDGGRSMNKENVQRIIRAVEKLKGEGGVGPNDVIRYGRLWMGLRKT